MNKTRLSGFQIIIYGIDGDGARGRGGGGRVEGEGKVHNILPKKVLSCHGITL